MSGRGPTLTDVIEQAIRSALAEAHVSLPCRVESYDAAKNTVDVQPLSRKPITLADGTVSGERLPVLRSVPVWFPGAGGFRITFPIEPGDLCWVNFGDYSTDSFRSSGGEADPVDLRLHNLNDGIALFGSPAGNSPWTGAGTDGFTVGKDGGPQIKITAGVIELGLGAEQAAALGDRIQAHLDALKIWADTLILPSAVGPAGPPIVLSPAVPDVTSSLVKVKI